MTRPILRIGLTGGIASGKSAVADEFASLGIAVIDADLISRELVEPGQPALARIVELFGPGVLDASGHLDRRHLRELVFADAARRKGLEDILHPAIRAELIRRSSDSTGPYQILVVPLLVENGLNHLVDRILVVDVPESTQMERLKTRDSIGSEQASRMLAAQTSRNARLAQADDVITNAGSLSDLKTQVAHLHRKYLGLRAIEPINKP
ncbi:MAG: dephospho-CoA kinase [Steroidobacteraceae bacterium]